MDFSPQALQTNGKPFSFFELTNFLKNNSGVGFMHTRWGVICGDQHAFQLLCLPPIVTGRDIVFLVSN